jgi:hypothetical protein
MLRIIPYAVVTALFVTFCGCIKVETDAARLPDAVNLPAIQEANQTKTKLQYDIREAKKVGQEVETTALEISQQRITLQSSPTQVEIQNLIESTQKLRLSALAILEKGPRFLEKIDIFSGTLKTAPSTFSTAAKLFRSFAEEERYKDIADDYRQVALMFDNLASRTETTGTALKKHYNREAILETLQYIRHQERFLDRLEAALRSQSFEDRELERFLDEITDYARKFDELRGQIRDLNTALSSFDEKPAASKTQPPKSTATAAPPKPPLVTPLPVVPPKTPPEKMPEDPLPKFPEPSKTANSAQQSNAAYPEIAPFN